MFFAQIRIRNKILIKMVCNFLKIAQELGEIILYFFVERKKSNEKCVNLVDIYTQIDRFFKTNLLVAFLS